MADNSTLPGTGDIVAADEIAGVKHQRMKVEWGVDGVATDTSASNPLPVVQTGALPAGAAVIGQTSIDQTTPGTTDAVTIKASVGIGSLTETAPATDTASSGLNGRLQRIAQRLTSLIALLPTALGANGGLKIEGVASGTTVPVTGTIAAVTSLTNALPAGTNAIGKLAANSGVDIGDVDVTSISAGENHLGEVGGNLIMISAEFTRPADTTAYAANDVVSDNTTTTTMQALANAARVSGGSGYITGLRVSTDKKSITPRFRLHFFNTTGATLAGDNVAYKDTYADSSKRVGYWDLPAMNTAADTTNSDNSRALDLTARIPYTCAATSLYYVLETLDAFTPASAQKLQVTLLVDRN